MGKGKGMILSDRIGAGSERRMRSGEEEIREFGWRKLELFLMYDQVKRGNGKENSAEASPSRKILRRRCVREAESHEANQVRRRNYWTQISANL